jgi:Zn-dependent oligopeptidase
MMGNFNRPKDGKSANIAMELVNTFFHEFGHNMHQALTEARWPSQSGSSVSMDFVEAPSQMLENWVESYETLSLLSDPANPLPRELFDKMMAAKSFTEILVNIRQVALAALDLTYHTMTPPPADTTAVVNKVFEEVGFLPEAAGTHFEAGFGHLMGGYEGTYSGYLSSKVLAQEFFTVFRRDGMLAPAPGRAYRSTVLAHGGSVDARDLTRWFLGREPDPKMKAFLESIGAL